MLPGAARAHGALALVVGAVCYVIGDQICADGEPMFFSSNTAIVPKIIATRIHTAGIQIGLAICYPIEKAQRLAASEDQP